MSLFVHQVAVSQRCLPLRCVICRDRILKLQQTVPGKDSKRTLTTPPPLPFTTVTPHISAVPIPTGRRSPTSPQSPTYTAFHGTTSCRPTSSAAPVFFPSPIYHEKSMFSSALHQNNSVHGEEEAPKSPPSNMEAFLHSHNDALNLRVPGKEEKSDRLVERKSDTKNRRRHVTPAQRRQDSPYISFKRAHSVKIHPQTTTVCNFLGSPNDVSPKSEVKRSTKTAKGSNFILKFLSRSNERRLRAT